MTDIAHVGDEPERRGAFRSRDDEWRPTQVLIALGSGPYGRKRHEMREVRGRDESPPHVRVRSPGKGAEPGFGRIQCLGDRDESPALNHTLHGLALLLD